MSSCMFGLNRSSAARVFIAALGVLTTLASLGFLWAQLGPTSTPLSFGPSSEISTSPVTGKPYEAERTLHIKHSLADGTMATQDIFTHEARDSSGRMFQEVQSDIPATSARSARQLIVDSVFDPAARTILRWTSMTKTGTLVHLPPPPPLNGRPQPDLNDGAESLGHRMILGLLCTGYAVQKTIPAGSMGNATPITTRHEWWVNNDLHLKALEIFNDPRRGQVTVELVSLKLIEPDAALFHLPSGYSVHELGASGSASASNVNPPLDLAHAPAVSRDEAIAMLASQDGQRQRAGAAALVKDARANADPASKADVAYRLARANVGLSEAEALATSAVESAERDCADQYGPVMERSVLTREISLARYWDTLGYIYDRQGDTDQAKSYIEGAWKLDPLAYYGSHLGRIDEQAGDTKQAVEIYRAVLQAPGSDELKQTIRERVTSLAADSETQSAASSEALAGVPAGLNGSAIFDVTYFSSTDSPTVDLVSGTDGLRALIPSIALREKDRFILPDAGPERVMRRIEVACGEPSQSSAGCRLRELGAHEARELLR